MYAPLSRRLLLTGGLAAAAVAVVGCAANDTSSTPAASATAAPGGAFPATVATKFGEISVPAAPTRIVALGWGDAEACLALGVQPVGASDWLQFGGEGVGPWAAGLYTSAPELIATLEPSFEAIAALAPDLILDTKSSGDQERYDKLAQIATTIGVPEGGDSYLITTEQQLTMIGTAVGQSERASALLAEVDAAFTAAADAHPEWQGKTVSAATKTSEGWGAYIESSERVGFLKNLGFVQNPKIAALETSSTGFSVDISTEELEAIDADLIVAFPIFIDTDQITSDRFFTRLPAVEDGRAVVIDGDLAQAYSLAGVLSQKYAVEQLVTRIEQALG